MAEGLKPKTVSVDQLCSLRNAVAIVVFVVVWVGLPTGTVAQGDRIVIEAVDGRSGKAIVKEHLLVFGGDAPQAVREQKQRYELTTDKDGLASLTLAPETRWLQVWVDHHVLCQSNPNGNAVLATEIVVSGASTPNICSKLSHRREPGHLIVFARRANFWEKMRR